MLQILVSNTGEWDPQSLGVITEFDSTKFRSFCDNEERLEDNSVPKSKQFVDTDKIQTLLGMHNMSSYFSGHITNAIVFPKDEEPDSIPNIYLIVLLPD